MFGHIDVLRLKCFSGIVCRLSVMLLMIKKISWARSSGKWWRYLCWQLTRVVEIVGLRWKMIAFMMIELVNIYCFLMFFLLVVGLIFG